MNKLQIQSKLSLSKEIKKALSNAQNHILNEQSENGSWNLKQGSKINGPEFYFSPIIVTALAIKSLVLLKIRTPEQINKGIYFLYSQKLDNTTLVDLFAYQLAGLQYSNCPIIEKKKNKILNIILNKQDSKGFWPSFPKTSNLTNFCVVSTLKKFICDGALTKMKQWLLKNKAKDNIGWGFNENSTQSQVSFTAGAIRVLLYCGEKHSSNEIIIAKKFILENQLPCGGWHSSDLTHSDSATSYGTASTLVALMLCMNNPINEKIEKGIKCLLNMQNKDGGWPLTHGEESQMYTTFYAIQALTYFVYLQDELKKKELKNILETDLCPEFTHYLLARFSEDLKTRYKNSYKNLLVEKSIATTKQAAKRRFQILKILEEKGALDTAEIIDELKQDAEYRHLHKRSHIAQIKNDVVAMMNLGLIYEERRKYYAVIKI
ncbi:terpene cyclase/mutase family protein [Candidatus Woesearchaeota archaeon]|jgi:hypothetical protein|nr:terpene cyclase/mutase family protein [Candidatus Woesearchaeota archaeon]